MKMLNNFKNFKHLSAMLLFVLMFGTAVSRKGEYSDTPGLAQTQWTGVMFVPTASDCILEFTQDTFNLRYEGEVVESMSYTTSGDTLKVKKLSGASPCNTETGAYKYQISNDKLVITLIKDDCKERAQAFATEGYKRVVKAPAKQ